MKKLSSYFFTVLLLVFFSSKSFGQGEPIQLSIVNPIQIVHESKSINGLRFNLIYGKMQM